MLCTWMSGYLGYLSRVFIYFYMGDGLYSLPASSPATPTGPLPVAHLSGLRPPRLLLGCCSALPHSRPETGPWSRVELFISAPCSSFSSHMGLQSQGGPGTGLGTSDISQEGETGGWGQREEELNGLSQKSFLRGRKKFFCYHSCLSFSPN